MPEAWRKCTLGDIVTLKRGYDLPHADRRPGPIPIVSSSGPSGWHDVAKAKAPGVVTGRYGTIGEVFYILQDYWPLNTALYVKDFKGNNPRFISYLLQTLRFDAYSDKSSVPGLNRNHLHRYEVAIPGLPEQQDIAEVLGALDDAVEQNRGTIRMLERLVRAVFRAWFVDFEPVKAKATGATAFPSMPQDIFDALPIIFVESELGPIPKGWAVKPIGDVVTVKGGATPSTKVTEYWEGGQHCWATPKDLSRLSDPVLLDTERRITDAGVAQISSGLLPVGTVLLSSRAPIGYLAITGVPTAVNQGFIAMVCDGPLPPSYVFNWTHHAMEQIKGRASGTTFPEISKTGFRPIPVVIPKPAVIEAFRRLVEPLFGLITATMIETDRVRAMRDYLLPRLLSGQSRVEVRNG